MRVALGSAPLLAASLAAGAGVALADPQSAVASGTIDGVVTDTNLASLSGANASILGTGIQVVTGANGRFRIVDLPAGSIHPRRETRRLRAVLHGDAGCRR